MLISSGVKITIFKFPNNSLNFFIFIPFKYIFFLFPISIFIFPSLSDFSYSISTIAFFSFNFIISLSFFALKDFPKLHKKIASIILVFPCAFFP